MDTERVRNAAILLMSTGQPRIHKHVYYGIHIKFWVIFMVFADMIFNTIPVFYAGRYRFYILIGCFIPRIAALYSVLNPKIRYLFVYKGLLLIMTLGSYAICCLQLCLLLIDPLRGCEKGYVRHTFAICGVMTPLELMCFLTISAYISYLSNPTVDDQLPPQPPTSPTEPERTKVFETSQSPNTTIEETVDSQPLLAPV